MGFNPKQTDRLYKALYNLTNQGIKEFKEGFKEILNPPKGSTNPEARFEKAIADCMIKNMLTSTAQDGDMLRAIATELIEKARKGEELTFADTKAFPYSDPTVFDKLVNNLSVMMTKAGIKAKMSGILSVLCPTQNIVKMYSFTDDKGEKRTFTLSQLEKHFKGDYHNIIYDKVQLSQKSIPVTPDFDTSAIEIGSKYLVELANGNLAIFNVKFPHDINRKAVGTRNIESTALSNKLDKTEIQEEIIGYNTFKQLI